MDFFRAAFVAASKQSGHQEHLEVYYSSPYIPQLEKEFQPIRPENDKKSMI